MKIIVDGNFYQKSFTSFKNHFISTLLVYILVYIEDAKRNIFLMPWLAFLKAFLLKLNTSRDIFVVKLIANRIVQGNDFFLKSIHFENIFSDLQFMKTRSWTQAYSPNFSSAEDLVFINWKNIGYKMNGF